MSIRSKHKTESKSEEEGKSWFGKIKSALYPTNNELPPKQKRSYNKTSNQQILAMLDFRKNQPKLSRTQIAKLLDVKVEVVDYYLDQKESTVRATLRARKGRNIAEKKRKQRLRIAEEKEEAKKLKETKSTEPEPVPVTFATPETEKEISLSTFAQLSEIEGQKILKKIDRVEKHPTHIKASPDYFTGTLPSQAVAGKEEWIVEERKYKIGKAVMHRKIKEKENEENRKDRLEQSHKDPKTRPKIHSDECPSCNRQSRLTLDEYKIWHFKEYLKRKEFAIKKQQKQLDQNTKQLDQRAKQLTEMEKDSLTVAERAKEGNKLCLVCDIPINYSQVSRCKGYSDSWGFGKWYCIDHEPPVPQKGGKK